jgi:hypothetical protein
MVISSRAVLATIYATAGPTSIKMETYITVNGKMMLNTEMED